MTLTMNEIYDEILRDGGMTPSKKIKQTSIRFPKKIAMRYKEFGVWQETTFEEFWKKSNYLSMGLKFFLELRKVTQLQFIRKIGQNGL